MGLKHMRMTREHRSQTEADYRPQGADCKLDFLYLIALSKKNVSRLPPPKALFICCASPV